MTPVSGDERGRRPYRTRTERATADGDLRRVADEQAALRRVAHLVARGAGQATVLDAIAAEAFELFEVDFTALLRYGRDGAASIIAMYDAPPSLAMGERAPHIPEGLVLQVFRTGAPARVEAYADVPGAAVGRMHELGITAGAAAPILVEARLWGVITAMTRSGTVAQNLEHTLARFAEIAATAVGSSQAHDDLRGLVDEQAALRRVAELAARGAEPEQVFEAVAVEASTLLRGRAMTLARFSLDGAATVVAVSGAQFPVGWRAEFTGDNLSARVQRTGAPARIDDYAAAPDSAAGAQAQGVRAGVAVPIAVEGRLWGMLVVTSPDEPLPLDTEPRLRQFADIAAAAISSAKARDDLRQLADEQAALRQVAELAAQDAPEGEVLEAVAVQAARLAAVDFTTVLSYEPDGSTEIVALSGAPAGLVVGMRAPAGGDGAVQRVWRTGRAARIENLGAVSGHWPQVAHGFGFSTSAAVPILIQGGLWGALVVVGRLEPVAGTIEQHLTSFADLAGTAISGAQARRELRALADEQAGLRRVAELVARGAALEEVFAAVAVEASALLGDLAAALLRYDPDGTAVNVAAHNSPAPLGLRVPSQVGTPIGEVLRTGRPERVDSFTGTSLAGLAEQLGVGAGVAVPVTVEGRVWGALTTSTAAAPLPAGTEERLGQFAGLAAAAIANAENKRQLIDSRARVVATADETRRRLQRDVHDGAQQRLVQTVITLKLARNAAALGRSVGDLIEEALYHAERATTELRDLVHGILPASLSQGGLRTGLEALIDDTALPVTLHMTAPRLPAGTETTAYFIVAEALTNVVKHARATYARITVDVVGAALSVEILDDGTGGADPALGTGLTGLSDRVQAAGGTLIISSDVGSGTTVTAVLPL